jgi:hypothetical protein
MMQKTTLLISILCGILRADTITVTAKFTDGSGVANNSLVFQVIQAGEFLLEAGMQGGPNGNACQSPICVGDIFGTGGVLWPDGSEHWVITYTGHFVYYPDGSGHPSLQGAINVYPGPSIPIYLPVGQYTLFASVLDSYQFGGQYTEAMTTELMPFGSTLAPAGAIAGDPPMTVPEPGSWIVAIGLMALAYRRLDAWRQSVL